MLITNMLNHQNNYLDVISLCFGTESLSEGEIQFFLCFNSTARSFSSIRNAFVRGLVMSVQICVTKLQGNCCLTKQVLRENRERESSEKKRKKKDKEKKQMVTKRNAGEFCVYTSHELKTKTFIKTNQSSKKQKNKQTNKALHTRYSLYSGPQIIKLQHPALQQPSYFTSYLLPL